MNDINIRRADEKDLSAILDLYAQPDLDDGEKLSLASARDIFKRMATYPNYEIYVATKRDQVVGTFALLIMDNLGHLGQPSGIVEDVAVLPEAQGRGIGKAMMAAAMERCRRCGCYKLALSSNIKRTRAYGFYQSLGFEQHGLSFVVNPLKSGF